MDLNLVEVSGKKDVIGKPFLYGTTGKFLDYFGLRNLDDLPRRSELVQTLEKGQVKAEEGKEDNEQGEVSQTD
jgi:segregation and condensation protein B